MAVIGQAATPLGEADLALTDGVMLLKRILLALANEGACINPSPPATSGPVLWQEVASCQNH